MTINPMNELLKRLAEDRRIAEREARQARIARLFERARELPIDAPPPKTTIQAETIVEAPVAPPRRPRPPRPPLQPLVSQAAPILEQLTTTRVLRNRHLDKPSWEIETLPTETPEQLFGEALASLGFAERPERTMLTSQDTIKKQPWWRR